MLCIIGVPSNINYIQMPYIANTKPIDFTIGSDMSFKYSAKLIQHSDIACRLIMFIMFTYEGILDTFLCFEQDIISC